jgi:hypothetical protein
MGRKHGDILPEKLDSATGRWKVSGDSIKQSCLAGAIGSEHSTPLTNQNLQGHVI